jgi:hypothetical protein
LFWTADVEVFANDLFKENPATDGTVENLSQRQFNLQDGNLVAITGPAIFAGERMR